MNEEQIIQTVLPAVVSAIATAIALYIGFTKGTSKTVDIALDKLEKRMKVSPTAKRVMKALEMSEKLFGDDQAVFQITHFFKEATELVSSEEAKNFFKNATEALKEFSSSESDIKVNLPKKPEEIK